MAQRVQVMLIDDLDGSTADETVTFALDGVSYEIDLGSANADKLRESLAPWVGSGRRTGGRKATGSRTAAAGKPDLGAVREWARSNGFQVSDRGRVAADVMAAYKQANG